MAKVKLISVSADKLSIITAVAKTREAVISVGRVFGTDTSHLSFFDANKHVLNNSTIMVSDVRALLAQQLAGSEWYLGEIKVKGTVLTIELSWNGISMTITGKVLENAIQPRSVYLTL